MGVPERQMTDALSHRLENEPLFTLSDLRAYVTSVSQDPESQSYVMAQARQRALEIIRQGGIRRTKA